MEFLKRTWAQIDLDCLRHNFELVRQTVPPQTKIFAVVKADAYGHGDQVITDELEKLGTDAFAVSNIEEALHIRAGGTRLPILILGVTPAKYAGMLANNRISQTVFSTEYAKALSEAAQKQNVTVDCHIKVDSGMGRIGFDALGDFDGALREIKDCAALPHLYCSGIFTHFAVADALDADDEAYTERQFGAFSRIVKALEEAHISFETVHCCNSAAILNHPEMAGSAVRAGIVLYGLDPSPDFKAWDLKPAMELKSTVSQIRRHPKGSAVSYGRTCTLTRDTTVATVPIGYADGYPRSLSNKGVVLVLGKRAPILGRVCMDQLMIDVTDIEGVTTDTVVTLFGEDHGAVLSVDELADLDATVNYELICLIGKRVPRVYVKNGKITAVVDCYYQNPISMP